MANQAPLESYSVDDLLRELRAREARAAPARALLLDPLRTRLEHQTEGPRFARSALRDVPSRPLFDALRRLQLERYGSDDRRDLFAVAGAPVLERAEAVAALFDRRSVIDNGDGTSTLETLTLGLRYGLCPSEPFSDQPAGAFGSGFLVAPAMIATAGHCVDPARPEEVRVVFGFRMIDPAAARCVVSNDDIYRGARVVGRQCDQAGPDWALIELDRLVLRRAPVPIRRAGKIADDQKLYVLGHPCGLPLKYADNAVVRNNHPSAFFVANLDTYGGNSGSPVFNTDHLVEGIVSRGEKDFVRVDGCYSSLVYPDNGPWGQECTRITELATLVPE